MKNKVFISPCLTLLAEHQPNTLEYNQNVVEKSDISETLVKVGTSDIHKNMASPDMEFHP